MGPEAQLVAQYGAVGILVLLLIGLGKFGGQIAMKISQLIDRFFIFIDKVESMLDKYQASLNSEQVAGERRHAETREHISASANALERTIRDEGAICREYTPTRPVRVPPRVPPREPRG